MLKQRIITALALLFFLGGAVFLLPYQGFVILAMAVFMVAAWEWANLCGFTELGPRVFYTVATLAVMVVVLCFTDLWAGEPQAVTSQVLMIAGVWWAVALLWVQGYPSSTAFWQSKAARAVMGIFVLVPCWLSFIWMRHTGPHIWLLIYLVAIVVAADVSAYFVGRAIGKRKLAINVSPGKSVEGMLGGLVGAALVALLVGAYFQLSISLLQWVVISLISALASVLGDLLESMMKRHRGIKDSSNILPGHGGVLDRLDGWTAAAPIFVLSLISAGWAG